MVEEWAPASRNMNFEFKENIPVLDKFGKPLLTVADSSNPWLSHLVDSIHGTGGKLGKPEILVGASDANFFWQQGVPSLGFSPMSKTPDLVHDHNEYLNQEEYLKGVGVYASIIRSFASYADECATTYAVTDDV